MLNIFIIISFVGAIVVSIIFAGVTFMQGVQSTLDAQITRQRLLDVATQIQSHGRIVGGYFALPQGANGNSPYAYNQVPSWITGNAAASANGVPFEYCPYATTNNGGTSGTVTMGDGATTYSVKYTNSAATISQNYVTDNNGTTVPVSGAVGLLVAAAPNRYTVPNCSSVTTSNGYPVVTGGIAVAVQNNYSNKMLVPTAMTDMRFYVSTAATGDGSGRDTSNYITLTKALNIISTIQPASTMIILDPTGSPTYTTSDSLSHGTRIYVTSVSFGPILNTSGNLTIDEYSLLSLGNVTLSSNSGAGTVTVNGTLEMDANATLNAGTLNIYGGHLNSFTYGFTVNAANVNIDGGGKVDGLGGTITFNSLANRGFKIMNGVTTFQQTLNLNPSTSGIVPVFVGAGGNLNVSQTSGGAGTVVINAANTSSIAGGIVVDPGGRIIEEAGIQIYKASSYGIFMHGTYAVENSAGIGSQLKFLGNSAGGLQYGIILASGSRLLINQNNTGFMGQASPNDPQYLIDDRGGSIFSSVNTTVYNVFATTNCWNYSNAPKDGNNNSVSLFMDSPVGTSTSNTSLTNNTNGLLWLRLYNNSFAVTCNIS